MSQTWLTHPAITPSPELIAAVGGHPLVARLLVQRGIDTPAKAIPFLDPDRYTPAPPSALLGVETAAQLLHAAIAAGQNILVWGDFDVDGQTSTSLLVTALQSLAGDEHVRFHVPNRFAESHGIKVDKLREVLATTDIPLHVLLTCDTGIAEANAVGVAKDLGMTVVVTDHHDLSAEFLDVPPVPGLLWSMPPAVVGAASVRRADAIVNPKFLPPTNPLRTLPGVGVAYKLVQQLYALAGRTGEEAELLDLVALGIVADVAEQVHDARYLLQRGLERLRTTRRAGLLALMNIARVDPAALTAESIGFQLGPRMNALGRLEDATVSVELLTTRDAIRAGQLAAKLERLNQERRLLTSQTTRAALDMIERDPSLLSYNALVLDHPHWHAGVVGIVASKLVEQFGKPTVLLLTPPGEAARGSARSVPGVDIGSAIAACSALLLTHGGHPGAAGLSLKPENVSLFRRELSRQVEVYRDPNVQTGIQIDAEVELADLSLALAAELSRLAPFGQGNPAPQLMTCGLTVVDDRRIGREGTHRKLTVRPTLDGDGAEGAGPKTAQPPGLPVLWFGGADAELPAGPLDLVYTLDVNEYKGERTLQLMYVDSRPTQARELAGLAPALQPAHIIDWRKEQTPAGLPRLDEAAWYAEGTQLKDLPAGIQYAPRWQLTEQPQGAALVLWSAPPSSELLRWVIETVRPVEIYLCARYTADDTLPGMLHAIAGMCKYALNHEQVLDLGRMAARLGTTEAIVRIGLLCLEAKGQVTLLEWRKGDLVSIGQGAGAARHDGIKELGEELEELLAETRAYRRFFQRTKPADLGLDLK